MTFSRPHSLVNKAVRGRDVHCSYWWQVSACLLLLCWSWGTGASPGDRFRRQQTTFQNFPAIPQQQPPSNDFNRQVWWLPMECLLNINFQFVWISNFEELYRTCDCHVLGNVNKSNIPLKPAVVLITSLVLAVPAIRPSSPPAPLGSSPLGSSSQPEILRQSPNRILVCLPRALVRASSIRSWRGSTPDTGRTLAGSRVRLGRILWWSEWWDF